MSRATPFTAPWPMRAMRKTKRNVIAAGLAWGTRGFSLAALALDRYAEISGLAFAGTYACCLVAYACGLVAMFLVEP